LHKIIFISVVISVILSGCSASRKSGRTPANYTKETSVENRMGSIIDNNLSKENFYIQRADIKVSQDNVSARLTASIKFRKPDTLLITVKSKVGIEAGRAFVTKDTIMLNDRINKRMFIGNPKSIESKYGIDPLLIFSVLGDVIIDDKEMNKPLDCKKGIYSSEFEMNSRAVEYTIDCSRKKAVKAYFEGDINTGNITIDYSNFVISGGLIYPQKVQIVDDLKSINVLLEIRKIEAPWNGKIEFVRGAGYKVVKIR
jgi:hypothetical protein